MHTSRALRALAFSRCGLGLMALAGAAMLPSAARAAATTLADWTFETSQPSTAGPFSPEVGAGAATGSHAGAAVYSSPAGNGSSHSFSSNTWAVGDYYQFQVSPGSLGNIGFQFDQTSSNTGPGDFQVEYSTDGSNFTDFGGAYTVLADATPNTPWSASGADQSVYTVTDDLSSITALNGATNVYLRLVDAGTVSANGGAVGSGGTDRVDNVIITASPVPEPTSIALVAVGGLAALKRRSRRTSRA